MAGASGLNILAQIAQRLREIIRIFQPNPFLCSLKRKLAMWLAFVPRRFASAPEQVDIQSKDPLLKRLKGPVYLHFMVAKSLCQITVVCSIALSLVVLTFQSQLIYAVGVNDQVNANVDYGTFQSPSANVRPRFRYWLPDASVNSSQVADDIRDAGRVGAGGVELLGYYLYGDVQIYPGNYNLLQSDWTFNYFGSPAWSEIHFSVRDSVALLTSRERKSTNGCATDSPRRRTCSGLGSWSKSRSRSSSSLRIRWSTLGSIFL